MLADPPFSRIDLISCRNLLIYLEPVLQQKIMPTLHYALKPAGFLWLGGSETIGSFRNLFEPQDAKHKIYAQETRSSTARHFPLQHGAAPRAPFIPIAARPASLAPDLHREADRMLLDQVRAARRAGLGRPRHPAIPRRHRPVPGAGPGQGEPEPAEDAARRAARRRARGRSRAPASEAGPAREEGLRVKSNGGYREVAVEVIPLKGSDGGGAKDGGFLVLFDETRPASGQRPRRRGDVDDGAARRRSHRPRPTPTTPAWRRSWPPPASTCNR